MDWSLLRSWGTVAVLGLQRYWCFRRSGLLPGISDRITLADKPSSETVVACEVSQSVILSRLGQTQGHVRQELDAF